MRNTIAIVVMGAAGAGKSTVGAALAAALGWPFLDTDAVHPAENVEKMRRGEGLTDADREPWLDAISARLRAAADDAQSIVLACSALKARYRSVLSASGPDVRYVYLHADRELLDARLGSRAGHFARRDLLESQLRDLEPPEVGALVLDASLPVESLVRQIRSAWAL